MSDTLNIFITGASSGIGRAIAHQYANQFAIKDLSNNKHVASNRIFIGLVGRRANELEILAQQLQKNTGLICAIYALDVRDNAALSLAAKDFTAKFGAPNIVIASAGVSRGTLTEIADDNKAIQAIFDINVMGMVNTFAPFIAAMKIAGGGQLVGVASVAGIRGIPRSGAYSASKAAVISYLEALRAEMQHFNIAVSTIAPGYVRTPMTEQNQYKMPFLMDADVFAEKFVNAVEAKVRFKVIPWQMGVIARLMRLIPPFLWDFAMKKSAS